MKKSIKKNIIDMLNTLNEAHGYVNDNIADIKNKTEVMRILSDCIGAANVILSTVISSEGDGNNAVSYLKDYCLAVKKAADQLNEGKDAENDFHSMDDMLGKAERSIKNDISVKPEILFIPYKASMWDSLESIWEAANADPNCDAYVMPIPYFDRNPDHSFGAMHYEGTQLPENVPIIDYRKYDLAKRCPDAIFIHNPYDGSNYVTSVHPDFYTKELKKYTDNIVYIPYYVFKEPKPENTDDFIEKKKSFVLSPGVLYSDYTVVQSSFIKNMYLKILGKHFKDNKDIYNKFKRNIYDIGSPKFDRITRLIAKGVKIPSEWEKIIKKSDGTNKKIVFYNIGLAPVLENNERAILKYSNVLKAFYKKRDEVALIWRPHPLIEATLKSMRPQLLGFYNILVEDYINQGWGIFDNTADTNIALAISDAYYGDDSSAIPLFNLKTDCIYLQWDTDEDEFLEKHLPNADKKSVEPSNYGKKIYDTIKKKIISN